jgi:putative transposase
VEEQRRVEILSFEHRLDVKDFVNRYMSIVRSAIDDIWLLIEWEEKGGTLVPSLKGLKQFEKEIERRYLKGLRGWPYSRHYIIMAVKDAYAIIESWCRRCLRGEASKEKPTPGNYIKIRWPFFNYKDGILTVPIKPNGECISIDLKNTPFWDRISGSKLVEVMEGASALVVGLDTLWMYGMVFVGVRSAAGF